MNTINNNLMARNTARQLQGHYGRLSSSVRRLSSGLRINSAADDAAGLAIRELMRSDISALQQGARNANDAISMLQVADGALAVIDEKLIRMKELAEQAATGTYNSTQRLMIESEYQAMAAEIDRIANATDFNGIKLLDGSLSGRHNGKGLQATGAMKIHFGTANDSAQDYYYIAIGDCTTKGLGLHNASGGGQVYYEKVEGLVEKQHTYKPPAFSPNYTDPVTGTVYYYDGDHYFTSYDDPASSALDWEKDGEIIARLRTQQHTTTRWNRYSVCVDPVTNTEYYRDGSTVYRSPYDRNSYLSDWRKEDKEILDRLQARDQMLDIETTWLVYENEAGQKYHSRDNGLTYVYALNNHDRVDLDSTNPAHKDEIAALKPVLEGRTIRLPNLRVDYVRYRDPQTMNVYLSSDNGKTFCTSSTNPEGSRLDPVKDRDLIARLVMQPDAAATSISYDSWYRIVANKYEWFYTADGGQTFIKNTANPNDIALSASNPADAAEISTITPYIEYSYGGTLFEVYEDTANGMKKYYTHDGGNNFCSDYRDPQGTALDRNDPGYAQLVANFVKTTTTEQLSLRYDRYHLKTNRDVAYYSCDGGKTFIEWTGDTSKIVLDSSNPADLERINRLVLSIQQKVQYTYFDSYYDPQDNNKRYYVAMGLKDKFVLDINNPQDVALDSANAADQAVIDRLLPVPDTTSALIKQELPDIYYTWEDPQSGKIYYSSDGGKTFSSKASDPYATALDPSRPADKAIIDNLQPHMSKVNGVEYIRRETGGPGVMTISTQQAAQEALEVIDRAIVSKDKIRAHLGAMQNRLENTITNLTIQAENLQAAESRISDADVALEMTQFVRNQILSQAATAMLGQANSFPHIMSQLIMG